VIRNGQAQPFLHSDKLRPMQPTLVAIDFETANEQRASACAIGLSWVEGGRVVRTEEHLIRPPELRFTPFTIAVHGIRPEDVADAPEFPEVWARLLPQLRGATLIAHNASFDMGVLQAMLAWYGEDVPDHAYLCTLVTARRVWPHLDRHKLNHLAWTFGITLDHHKAGSDARACAEIALHAMRETGTDRPEALAAGLGLTLGRIGPGGAISCKAWGDAPARGSTRARPLPQVLRDPALVGQTIAFTGALQSLSRGEAETLAAMAGLTPHRSVTRGTDILVVGRTRDSTKLRTARNRQMLDGRPRLLGEAEFRTLLGLPPICQAGSPPTPAT